MGGTAGWPRCLLMGTHTRTHSSTHTHTRAHTHTHTLLQTWQYERYVLAAWRAGYQVREELVGRRDAAAVAEYAARCVHDVAADKIAAMAAQWQDG